MASSLADLLGQAVQPDQPDPAAQSPVWARAVDPHGLWLRRSRQWAPIPPNLPPYVQDYITQMPSYTEGQAQGNRGAQGIGESPWTPPEPQIGDIQRLFGQTIQRNNPNSQQLQNRALLRPLMRLPGFSGFTGGDEI